MPPKARKLPRRGWLDSLFTLDLGVLFSVDGLSSSFSPVGVAHRQRISEEAGINGGCLVVTSAEITKHLRQLAKGDSSS